MGILDIALGGPLIGSFVNSMLFMLEIAFIVLDDLTDKQQSIRLMVIGMMFVETVGTLAVCSELYLNCVTLWGNPSAFINSRWPYPLLVATTAITGMIVQVFLLRRLFSLYRSLFVVLTIALFVIAAFIGAILMVVVLIRYPSFLGSTRWDPYTRLWSISSAVADILLAGTLIWRLRQVKSPFKATNTLLRQLMVMAIETGAITSALFIVTIILLLMPMYSPIAVALEMITGRAYANTLLYNLRKRKTIGRGSISVRTTDREIGAFALSHGGVRVTRSQIEQRDNGVPDSAVDDLEDKSQLSPMAAVRFEYPPTPSSSVQACHAL